MAYTFRMITDQEIFFSKPDSFNDPFEFRPILSLEANRKEIETYLDGLFKQKMPLLTRQQRKKAVVKAIPEVLKNRGATAAEILKSEAIPSLVSLCGVYCLSADSSNILMWSHYSDNHRGVCFGFDASINSSFFRRAQKIKYATEYPVANIIIDTREEFQEKIVLTKSTHWSYENEWRIIDHNKGAGIYKFPKNELKEIIFGDRVSDFNIKKIQGLIKESGMSPDIYKARLHERKYEIILDEFVA